MFVLTKAKQLAGLLNGDILVYNQFKKHIKPTKKFPLDTFASQGFEPNVCWKCGLERKNTKTVFCEECKVIQAPHDSKNYFKVFNLDEKFDIDTKELRDKYRKMQSYLHPDKFSNSSDEEKEISVNYSSLVNKAYSSLQVPLKRAEHLLELKGDKLGEEQTVDDPEFLMEMMELNEELENTKDVDKLRQLDSKNRTELENIARSIDECFKQNDLKQAKYFVVKMKYYSSLGNRINALLREMGVVD